MSAYGSLLKNLINFSGSKLSTVAEEVGYDVSLSLIHIFACPSLGVLIYLIQREGIRSRRN